MKKSTISLQANGLAATKEMPMADLTVNGSASADVIRSRIFTIRGVQVMLDRDIAALYGVTTGALNQAVKRNKSRFPERFMFQMNKTEVENLKSQSVISSFSDSPGTEILKSQPVISSWGGSRSYPYAFTEQGIAMLSSVLRSETAILVSIKIMDVFVAMRKALASFAPMLTRLDVVERRQIVDQARNEERFKLILDAMQDKRFPPQKVFYDGQIYDALFQNRLLKALIGLLSFLLATFGQTHVFDKSPVLDPPRNRYPPMWRVKPAFCPLDTSTWFRVDSDLVTTDCVVSNLNSKKMPIKPLLH